MITRNKAKLINSLRIPKYRKKHGLFVAEGTKLVLELLKSDFGIYEIYATSDWIAAYRESFRQVDNLVVNVEQQAIDELSSLSTPPSVLALIELPELRFHPAMLAGATTLMLDGINDPGNLGSIIRSADWFGIDQIVCSSNTVDVYHPKVVQATMGSIFRKDVYEAELVAALASRPENIDVYGAFMDGVSIYETQLKSGAIYIIGSESHGISSEVESFVDHRITIPRFAGNTGTNETESLNAAVATAIIIAELRRPEH
jgi:RNA methyltransferase, TrmH family